MLSWIEWPHRLPPSASRPSIWPRSQEIRYQCFLHRRHVCYGHSVKLVFPNIKYLFGIFVRMVRRLNVILSLLMDCFKFIGMVIDWLTGVSVGVFNKNLAPIAEFSCVQMA